MRPFLRTPLLLFLGLGFINTHQGAAAEFKLDGHNFTLPAGFTIERIAAPELTQRPVHADFDEQGRLYVAESSGSNDPVQKQLEDKPHSILRLEDTNGDGVFDQRTVFSDRMMFPEGVLWHDGSVYVTAPPEIWKLTDTTGDGVADQREVWFNPGTLTGCANDLHGPFLGRDGWIYWSKGAFAKQELELAGGGKLETRAAHIFRRHPSGGGVEVVMTGGMDNPVEFVMTPAGEKFFTSTFMLHPGGGKRDGIGHASYGALFGKPHDVLDDHPRTGPALTEPITHLGPAAPTGLCLIESAEFGPEYRGNLFATMFNLHKVTRHVLVPEGAGFRTIDEDFLVSENRDFHPTDVFEDADGSLIVIDTGGWYKICCPTSQLYKPDVFGGIYRIRKTGAHRLDDSRGRKLDWTGATPQQIAGRLADQRPVVRQRALGQLAGLGGASLPALEKTLAESRSADARVAAIWALAQIDDAKARALTRPHLAAADPVVRQAALASIALWRDQAATIELLRVLAAGAPSHRRGAAEALGRISDAQAVPALVLALAYADATLQPALTRALIDIGNAPAIRAAVAQKSAAMPLGALIALDQLGAATVTDVLPLLASNREADRQTADWIIRRHADWGAELTQYFETRLAGLAAPDETLATQIGRMAASRSIREWLAVQLNLEVAAAGRVTLLQAMSRSGVRATPPEWKRVVTGLLGGETPAELRAAAVHAAATFNLSAETDNELKSALTEVARETAPPAELRMTALAAVPNPFFFDRDPALFAFALQQLAPDQPVLVRQLAARALGGHPLSVEQRRALLEVLPELGPMELNAVLPPFEEPAGDATDARLMETLGRAKAFRSLNADRVRRLFTKYPAGLQPRVMELVGRLDVDFAEQQRRLDATLASLPAGDIRRGQELFNSPRAACNSCHAIGYLGGDLGPDLTRIGQIRNQRDLLEAILFPSASFVRSYETVTVRTRDGEDHQGIVREDARDHVVLATGPGVLTSLSRPDIAELTPGAMSLMPGGLDQLLSAQELADLLAFLMATRW
jgi:putative membrane-bound dehydrogenase-like protein